MKPNLNFLPDFDVVNVLCIFGFYGSKNFRVSKWNEEENSLHK
jgi:hypothetical protein